MTEFRILHLVNRYELKSRIFSSQTIFMTQLQVSKYFKFEAMEPLDKNAILFLENTSHRNI